MCDASDSSETVAVILVLELPQYVKQLRTFLVIVQYYRKFQGKFSNILAPLMDIGCECGVTKSTKKEGTKKEAFY